MNATDIVSVEVEPIDIDLTEPFAIAGGAPAVAANVLVRIALDIVPCNNKLPTASVRAPGSEARGSQEVRLREVPLGEFPPTCTPRAKVIWFTKLIRFNEV